MHKEQREKTLKAMSTSRSHVPNSTDEIIWRQVVWRPELISRRWFPICCRCVCQQLLVKGNPAQPLTFASTETKTPKTQIQAWLTVTSWLFILFKCTFKYIYPAIQFHYSYIHSHFQSFYSQQCTVGHIFSTASIFQLQGLHTLSSLVRVWFTVVVHRMWWRLATATSTVQSSDIHY